MPTVRGIPGPFRFYFYSIDCREPPHVHIDGPAGICKVWLEPLEVASSSGMTKAELRAIRRTILEYRFAILEAWYEHCRKA
jgi:hypothetical protein